MRILIIAFALFLTSSCASTPPKPEIFEKARGLPCSFEIAWAATIEVLAENEWPIEAMERESGLITTSFVDFGSNDKYHSCASGMAYIITKYRGKLSVFVKSITESETELRINTHLEGWNTSSWGNEGWTNCNSTGVLEGELFDQILALL